MYANFAVTAVCSSAWEEAGQEVVTLIRDLISITVFVTVETMFVSDWCPGLTVPRQHANQGTKRWTGNLCQFYLQIEIFHWGLRQLWRILNIHNKLSSHHWYTQSIDHLTSSILLRVERRLFLLQFRLVRGEWRGWGWASHCQQINQSTKKRESLFSDELWLISRLSASVNAEK